MPVYIKKNGALQQVGMTNKIELTLETKNVTPDFSNGDISVTPTDADALRVVNILKPLTLLPENIKNGVTIAGVVGNYVPMDNLAKRINGSDEFYTYIVPNDITNIRSYSFYYDMNITSITLSNAITYIGVSAFEECRNLTTFIAGSGLQNIGGSVLKNCDKLVNVTLNNGLLSISSNMFLGCTQLANLSIPSTVTSIGDYAFQQCAFTSMVISNNVTSLESGVFARCASLTNVDIGIGVSTLKSYTFEYCNALTDITLRKANGIVSLSNINAFDNISQTITIHVPSNLITQYQQATNWSTLYNNNKVTFVALQL